MLMRITASNDSEHGVYHLDVLLSLISRQGQIIHEAREAEASGPTSQ